MAWARALRRHVTPCYLVSIANHWRKDTRKKKHKKIVGDGIETYSTVTTTDAIFHDFVTFVFPLWPSQYTSNNSDDYCNKAIDDDTTVCNNILIGCGSEHQ